MRIAVIGTGSVGSALADGFASAGHDVVVGSRDPGTVDLDLDDRIPGVDLRDQRGAVEAGDVVVLATPPGVAVDIADEFFRVLADKAVIDPTNEYPEPTGEESVAQRIAAVAPGASVAKAFNTIGAEHLADPGVGGGTPTMFVAATDTEARETVVQLAADLGFDPVLAGDLPAAGRLEDLGRLWIDLSRRHGREVAFRLLRE